MTKTLKGFTVIPLHGCLIVRGDPPGNPVPITAFSVVSKALGNASLLDLHLARIFNAAFVGGMPEALAELRNSEDVALAIKAIRDNLPPYLSTEEKDWAAAGEIGLSSAAIFFKMTGFDPLNDRHRRMPADVPSDPADFRRCALLLEAVPKFAARLDEMRTVSAAWSSLVDRWTDVMTLLDLEVPSWRNGYSESAPRTYGLLRQIAETNHHNRPAQALPVAEGPGL